MKGARATTHAIWLAFHGEDPMNIRQTIASEYGYDLTQTVDSIRPDYAFDVTCQGTVPQAITCALESVSYEDAVRNAISLGGDADTLAAIAGGPLLRRCTASPIHSKGKQKTATSPRYRTCLKLYKRCMRYDECCGEKGGSE